MTLAAPLDAPIAPTDDQRRITENDPRVVALRAVWRSRIARSIGQLTRELRALPPHTSADATLSVFIHRHVGLLRAAYQDGHELGARDYYAGVSRRPQQWARTVETDERTERRRLAFYAPSVAKMAHEALLAWQQDQAARVHASEAIITFSGEGYNPYRDAHGRFAPGPHAPREGEGEGGAGHGGSLKPEGERGTGSYLARFTPRPHEDLARGWTGGMMKAQPTPEDADIAWIHDRYGSGEVGLLEEKWKEETDNVEAEAQYYGHPFTRPARMEDDEKFMLRVERDYRLDPREAAPGKWVIYDHPGLAGHKVRVENHTREPDTDQSAAEAAHKQRDMYRFNYHAGEDGDATVGEVRYVRDLGGGLHLFWAQNVVPEHETRQQYREQSGNLSVRMFADDSLDQWQGSLGARLTLQADVSWSGLQDGYVDAGAGDSIGLYSLLYWLLEPLAAHCDGCLEYAANSPYNAPGLGGNTLDTAPGAGMTECGAACKCSLSYAAPGEIEQPFWNTMFAAKQQEWIASGQQNSPLPNVAGPARTDTAVVTQPLPRRAPPTIPLEPLEPLTLPMEGAPLTDEQKSALDLYRATALAWEEWRGGLPPLPKMFADLADAVTGTDPQVNAWLDNMPSWTQLSPKQQQLLGQVYEALADWALATSEAAHDAQTLPPPDVTGGGTLFAEWMAGRRLLHGYNPYRDPHGRFAPGPHAPREGEGEGGGGGGAGAATKGGRARGGAGGNGHAKGATHQQQPHEPTKAQATHARAVSRKEEAANAAAKAKGHEEFLASHAAAVARREGKTGAGQRKAQQENIHEKSARLQREQGLRAEANPHTMARDQHGMLKLEQRTDIVHDPTHIIDVSRGVNPHQLVRVYGEHQLGAALTRHSASELKGAADSLGIKAGRTKAETVSRITAHVTEGRYSANFAGEARTQRAAKAEAAAKREDAAKRDASTRTASRTAKANPEPSQLTPVMHLPGRIINPALSLDPHFVRAAFGDHQLHAALAQHSHSVLRDAAQNLGVRPGRDRETTIQRLMSHVQQTPMETLQSHYRAHPNTPYSSIQQSGTSAHATSLRETDTPGDTLTFSGEGYNPYRDAHGRFAPGPHAPHEDENSGGGGGHGGGAHATGPHAGHAAGGGGGGSGGGSTTHAGHPVHQMTPAEREAKAQGELDAAHARYQHALDSHGVANQELRQARIHESTAAAAYADAHKNAEGELRHQAMQDAKVREPARYAQYERLARAAQEHVDRFNDLSRQEPHALDHVATVRRALFARGLSAREVDAHPDYVQASRDFHAIANERKLQGHLYTQSTRAANRAADRLVGDRVSEDAIHAHPLVAPAHAALTAASAHANALEANRQHWEHEAVSAQAAVQRAEGMLDVARGGSGVAVKYWPSRAGQSAQDAIHQTFGRDLSEHELAKLSGASVGDKMDVQPAVGTQGGISVSLRGPGIERRFSVVRDAQNGDIILHDEYTANKGERTAGSGRDLIRGMDNMRAVGVTRLYATAARGPALNGYHTWARMGFVGDVPHGLKLAVKSHFGPTVTRVEQVMERPGGAAWWKQFGSTWDAEFDFHPGSYSMRRLDRLRAMIDRHGEG